MFSKNEFGIGFLRRHQSNTEDSHKASMIGVKIFLVVYVQEKTMLRLYVKKVEMFVRINKKHLALSNLLINLEEFEWTVKYPEINNDKSRDYLKFDEIEYHSKEAILCDKVPSQK